MIPAKVLNVSEARDRLSDLMGRAFYRNETFVIARKGTPMVVLMSIEEYNALQAARSEQAVGYDVGHYKMQVKEWAKQYEVARATLETQHPALDQEEAERLELTALLDELEHPQVLPPLGSVTEIDGTDFLTTDKVQNWLKGIEGRPEEVSELKGFAASAGVTEGPARVLKLLEEIVTLQPGEIMVVPNTNPAWVPVFSNYHSIPLTPMHCHPIY